MPVASEAVLKHALSAWKGCSPKCGNELLRIIEIMLGAPRRGLLTSPKPHELNLLVTSDRSLVRISPRGCVALQDAHLRSGVRLIARNRCGRRDDSGAPMAVVAEG